MPAWSRSDSSPQLEQSRQGETDGFLPETDRVRGLCNRQPGLGGGVCDGEGLSRCPTSPCYVVIRWQSAKKQSSSFVASSCSPQLISLLN